MSYYHSIVGSAGQTVDPDALNPADFDNEYSVADLLDLYGLTGLPDVITERAVFDNSGNMLNPDTGMRPDESIRPGRYWTLADAMNMAHTIGIFPFTRYIQLSYRNRLFWHLVVGDSV